MTFRDEYLERLLPWSDVQYCMPRMHDTAASYPGVAILELGVRSGFSTSAFLAAAEQAQGHLWSIDVNDPEVPAHWLESPLWTFIKGDDVQVPFVAPGIDVLFIDTIHTYSHTLAELHRFVPMVKPGGTVLLHDTVYSMQGEEGYPVARALDTFCTETGRKWVEHGGGEFGFGEIPQPNG
jgi:predicted O-methyltransferase YrrM